MRDYGNGAHGSGTSIPSASTSARAKFPKAKTWTDKQGNVRAIGGRIVRAAPKPGAAVKPPVNPLDAAVGSAITSQVKPYEGMEADRVTQYNHDLADQRAVQDEVQQQLLGIHRTLATANNDALGLAAARGTDTSAMQRNQNFLRDVLGNYVGDGGAGMQTAIEMGQSRMGADAAGNAAQIGLAGRASEGHLSTLRAAENMAHGERAAALLAKRQADQHAIENEIARIRAQAPLLRRQFGREDEEMRIAKQDLALRRQQAADQRASNQAQVDLGYYQTDAQAAASLAGSKADAAKEAAANASRYATIVPGLNKKYDDAIEAVRQAVMPTAIAGADGTTTENPNHRWRAAIDQLKAGGLTTGQAVLLASAWLPDRLKVHGADSPRVIYRILKSGELGGKLSDAVAKKVFQLAGLDWSQRNKRNPTAGGVGNTLLNGTQDMLNPGSSSRPPKPTKAPNGQPIDSHHEWIWTNSSGWVYRPK